MCSETVRFIVRLLFKLIAGFILDECSSGRLLDAIMVCFNSHHSLNVKILFLYKEKYNNTYIIFAVSTKICEHKECYPHIFVETAQVSR